MNVMNELGIALRNPTDSVFLDNASADKLYSLWCGFGESRANPYIGPGDDFFPEYYVPVVPVDLMLSRTVPLPDFDLVREYRGIEEHATNGKDLVLRISTLFPEDAAGDYEIHALAKNSALGSFAFIYRVDGRYTEDYKICWESQILPLDNDFINVYLLNEDGSYVYKYIKTLRALILADWYAIQLALLHPTIKTVFANPVKEKVYERTGKGKNRKRQVRYVKRHVIRAEDIEEALAESGHYERHTMAWYVIGHYRTYKNGRRIFVNGYWKGPLRKAKANLDKGRDRLIGEKKTVRDVGGAGTAKK